MLNLLVVACVFLCLKFVELFVRGRTAAAAARIRCRRRARLRIRVHRRLDQVLRATDQPDAPRCRDSVRFVRLPRSTATRVAPGCSFRSRSCLQRVSFLAKEDFALPILVATACLAITSPKSLVGNDDRCGRHPVRGGAAVQPPRRQRVRVGRADRRRIRISSIFRRRRWYRRSVACCSRPRTARMVVVVALAAVVVAIAVNRRDRPLVLRLAALFVLALVAAGAEFDLPESCVRLLRVHSDRDALGDAGRGVLRRFGATAVQARTFDWPGAMLLLIAAIGVWMSHEPRSASARWYAEVAAYNRSITAFLQAEPPARCRAGPLPYSALAA